MGDERLRLASETVGALPVVNRFLSRLRVDEMFFRHLPPSASPPTPKDCLLLLLRNLVLGRAPIYGLAEWAAPFRPSLLGLTSQQVGRLNDDRVGRALDHLFDADRASMLTEVVVRAIREFGLEMDEFHNDSTSISFSGQHADARGGTRRGRPTLRILHGHNKDHRPDLKQLLWILTVTADGAVPVHYRACDGNTTDSPTHRQTWDAIRAIIGRSGFLYVADCKLCTEGNLTYIDSQHGRFITVLPRSCKEDEWFRRYVQDHALPWEEVERAPNPRILDGPPDVYRMVGSPMPSTEGFRIVWVWSSQKAELDRVTREALMERAVQAVEQLETRLRSPRTRMRTREAVERGAARAVGKRASRWIACDIREEREPSYRQERRGRPGKGTRYRRAERVRFHVGWRSIKENIEFDARTDGMFPLVTNCTEMPRKDLLAAYKYQPMLEKRHEQLKTVYEVVPVLLKKVTRIEGLLFLYFLVMLVQALIEREVRQGMEREGIASIPLYPEERDCEAPTIVRLLEVLGGLQVHHLWDGDRVVRTFHPELTRLQKEVLALTGTPDREYVQ